MTRLSRNSGESGNLAGGCSHGGCRLQRAELLRIELIQIELPRLEPRGIEPLGIELLEIELFSCELLEIELFRCELLRSSNQSDQNGGRFECTVSVSRETVKTGTRRSGSTTYLRPAGEVHSTAPPLSGTCLRCQPP